MRRKLAQLGLVLLLAVANVTLFTRSLHSGDVYQRCVIIETGTGDCAQGCEDWIFTHCGDSDCCYDGNDCDEDGDTSEGSGCENGGEN